ncbi:uncharacterized protein [Clytia hemisphaerica]|uniref:uncharacterized protein n=1 Tax=Clytia hemisphaerica TaxID=252671 RepID=UPI0034D7B64D
MKQDEIQRKQRSIEFLVNNINRDLKELTEQFSKDTETATDEDISKWKKEIPHLSSKVDKVADNIKTLMQTRSSDASYETTLKNVSEQFETLFDLKKNFILDINDELAARDIEKSRDFNRSRLNIKIEKFSGYDSKIDFFTFRTNFEKLHLKTTPKQFLPELLKNNFLTDHALNFVRNLDDIDIIWERLKGVYGNPKMMLSKRLLQLQTLDVSKSTKPEKAIDSLTKVINVLQDLMRLAQEHNIEEYLYYGEGLNTIYQLIGDVQTTKFLDTICTDNLEQQEIWSKLISFLDHQKRIHQQRLMIQGPTPDPPKRDPPKKDSPPFRRGPSSHHTDGQQNRRPPDQLNCFICQATNHVATNGPQGSKIVQYFACPVFVNMTPIERFNALKSKGLCFQCLYPGAKYDQGKHKEGRCQKIFCCKDTLHDKFTHKKHVLVCDEHKSTQENKDLFDFYKSRCISKIQQLEAFTKDMRLTYHFTPDEPEPNDHQAIYVLQTIEVDQQQFTLFYDNGCKNSVIKFDATKRLGSNRAKQIISRPIPVGGVGGVTTQSTHGIYTFSLPLATNNGAEMTGLPSGLTIYQSQFKNIDGSYGVIGGPHEVFTSIENHHLSTSSQFVASQLEAAKFGFYIDPDIRLLGSATFSEVRHDLYFTNNPTYQINNDESEPSTSYITNLNEKFESVGTDLNYRCVNCRKCLTCKNHSAEDSISIQEEVEQDLINRSITIDPSNCSSIANLPLIHDPLVKLAPNRDIALRVYIQQLKRLEKHQDDKDDILISEKKLQYLRFVEYVKHLPTDIQKQLSESQIKNFIPWRAVWKGSSISTPCRIVFDASMPTSTGFSLNDILAKGRNSMNKLLEIFLRWRGHRIAFHTDVQKMYNSVKLRESDWCLQRYLWQEHLDPSQPPEEKVIMTLIYGVKSSGNQAETALRETVKIHRKDEPEVARVITEDVYVDDCLSGGDQISTIKLLCQSIDQILSYGGFTLKGFTISGEEPKDSLTADGTTISVAGMKWHPKNDLISFDINLDFAKKYRGKKLGECKEVPKRLTRRICSSKAAEIFDMTGLLTPRILSFSIEVFEYFDDDTNSLTSDVPFL